jgi:hypothetical protein
MTWRQVSDPPLGHQPVPRGSAATCIALAPSAAGRILDPPVPGRRPAPRRIGRGQLDRTGRLAGRLAAAESCRCHAAQRLGQDRAEVPEQVRPGDAVLLAVPLDRTGEGVGCRHLVGVTLADSHGPRRGPDPEAHGQFEEFLDTHLGRRRRGPFRLGHLVVIALTVSHEDRPCRAADWPRLTLARAGDSRAYQSDQTPFGQGVITGLYQVWCSVHRVRCLRVPF